MPTPLPQNARLVFPPASPAPPNSTAAHAPTALTFISQVAILAVPVLLAL